MKNFHKRVSYLTLIILLVIAITSCIISSILYYASSYNEKNKVYTTATISKIDEVKDENTTEITHLTYVKYTIGKKTYEAKINYYDQTYEVGQEIKIYYYKDDHTKAGTEEGEHISIASFVASIVFLVSIFPYLSNTVTPCTLGCVSNSNAASTILVPCVFPSV